VVSWVKLKEWVGTTFAGSLQPTRSDWIFALRTTSAGLIALLAAYALKLEHPQWAMMTVFIVAQPVAGMVLAKGFYRLIGTVVGAVAAMGFTFAFGGNPWLFVAVLSLWIGLCTLVSSLLRNPEAYGAALAGYTAMIVGLPAFGQPHLITDLAVARCEEIILGIACAAITSRLVLPRLAGSAITARLERCILDLAAYTRGAFAGAEPAKLDALYRKLVADTQTLGEMRAYARLEAPSVATRAHPVRRTIGHLLSALSAARMLHSHAAPQNAALLPVRGQLKALVGELVDTPNSLENTRLWEARLTTIANEALHAPDSAAGEGEDPVGTITRLTVAGEFAQSLREVLRGLDAVRRPTTEKAMRQRRQPALIVHRDHHAAWRNAIRATVATMLVASFWLATHWSEAAGTLILVAVVSSLFASRPDPAQVSWGFFKGTLLALPVAFVVGQLALPALPGFGWFVLFVVPILVPAALAMANPRLVGVATAFAINFLAFLNPHQGMSYDPVAFFAGSISVLVGILIAIGVFMVVLPVDPIATARRIAGAMREDLVRLCLHDRIPRRSAFESLAYDRVNQMMPLVQQAGRKSEGLFDGSVASVMVGLELLRLRIDQKAGGLPSAMTQNVSDFLRQLARNLLVRMPNESWIASIAAMRADAAAIAATGTPDALRVAASLRVVAAAAEDYPDFFRKD